ncbi:MAG: protein kinase, partial [Acidobacteriota bacterium]
MIEERIGNYRVLSQIGQGGMGTVYQAEDERLGRKVAIKILNRSLLANQREMERFQSEAKIQANLNHANVVTLYGFEPYKDSYCMIMEYVEGRTLADLIRTIGPLPTHIVVMISKQVLEGLSAAHRQGVIHRDLKSSNIMLTRDGVAKVMDFGIAKVEGGKSLTASGALVGTVFYMSPEQVRGEPLDARADLYSFGIILFELLTGRVPFKDGSEFSIMINQVQMPPPPPTQLLPDIPSDIENVVLRCLNKRPEDRYQNAGEVLAALEAFQEQERAAGRGDLYARKTLAQWLCALDPPQAAVSVISAAGVPAYAPTVEKDTTQSLVGATTPSVAVPGQAPMSFFAEPSSSQQVPPMPTPVPQKPSSGKGPLLVFVLVVLVLVGASLAYSRLHGSPGILPRLHELASSLPWGAHKEVAVSKAQVGVPENPTAAITGATTASAPEQTPPSTSSATSQAAMPASGLPGTPINPDAKATTFVSAGRRDAEPMAPPKSARTEKPNADASPPGAVKSHASLAITKSNQGAANPGGQTQAAEVKPAEGVLIFLDLDQSSERLPLSMAQAHAAELVRAAGHEVVSGGIVGPNVRAALDRNDLAEVRRNGVGFVIMGSVHASIEPQTAYGSTYYAGQVSVALELVRMSD